MSSNGGSGQSNFFFPQVPLNTSAWLYAFVGLLVNMHMLSHAEAAKVTDDFVALFDLDQPRWRPATDADIQRWGMKKVVKYYDSQPKHEG